MVVPVKERNTRKKGKKAPGKKPPLEGTAKTSEKNLRVKGRERSNEDHRFWGDTERT